LFRRLRQTAETPYATTRKTKIQKTKILFRIFAISLLGVASFAIVFNSLAEIIQGNDARVGTDSDLTYYLSVKEDGVDASGVESSDTQMANITSGRISVTDKIPDGLVFQGFVTTSDGTFGAVSREPEHASQCAGKVVDDTQEEAVDTGTWNNDHTEYYYHGLHYNANTRTVSFVAEKIKAGCELTIGIITKTPSTIDDPDTSVIETRRDFFNTAFAAEKDLTATSNTVHAWMGNSSTTSVYQVSYSYTGDVPVNAPGLPGTESYQKDTTVAVSAAPELAGYTFNGWTTSDATVTDGHFTMPDSGVNFVGVWVLNTQSTEYRVTYVIDGGVKPGDFMPPAEKSYTAGTSVALDSTAAGANIDGYEFSGWSSDDVVLSETGFTMPATNVTISGSFTRISYQVCYEFEGTIMPDNADNLLPGCETHYPGDTVTTAAKPTATGYQFIGWYKNPTFEMPEHDVTIQGEWAIKAGTFTPSISKTLVENRQFIYGETARFKITVSNSATFPIKDVFIEEQLDGAVFVTGDGYTVKTSTIAFISQIPSNSSVDVYAEYKVTENATQSLTNVATLTGAIADNNYILDESGNYSATASFYTVAEPAPFTGILFNALPYVGLIMLGITAAFVAKISFRRKAYRE